MPTKGNYPLTAKVVKAIQCGSAGAEEYLYHYMTRGRVRYWIFSKLNCPEDAEDLIHDAFIDVVKGIKNRNIRKLNAGPAYVYGVILNKLHDHYAGLEQKRLVIPIDEGRNLSWHGIRGSKSRFRNEYLTVKDPRPSPVKVISIQEQRDKLKRTLQRLPEGQREVMRRVLFLEQTQDEVEKGMKITSTQFRLFRWRGKKNLTNLLSVA